MAGRRVLSRCQALVAIGLAVVSSAVLVAVASGETVSAGDLLVSINGAIRPAKLPKNTFVPVTLSVNGSFKTTDASHVPALSTVALQFDRHGVIDTAGLATCKLSQLQSTLTAQARKACGAALVGGGNVSAEIDLPEQAPFTASGPLLIFNGVPRGGKPVLLMHVHADVPAPTTFVTSAVIEPGVAGSSLTATLPSIDSGYGYISSFDFSLKRQFEVKGQKQSFISADCPAPGGLPGAVFPLAKASYQFADGRSASAAVLSQCTVKK